MTGDYSRFSFDPNKDYSSVLKQQGRVSLDSDWNEAQAIADRRLRAETIDLMGATAVPETTPDAFKIEIDPDHPGTFKIGRGRMYVDGLLVECHGASGLQFRDPGRIPGPGKIPGSGLIQPTDVELNPVGVETDIPIAKEKFPQPIRPPYKPPISGEAAQAYDAQLGEMYGKEPIPYHSQPNYYPYPPSSPPLSSEKGATDLVYLKVWQREVTVIADPEIKEIALGGADTTTRLQTVWQVKVLHLDESKDKAYSCGDDQIHEWQQMITPSGGRLSTSVVTPPASDNPCDLPPVGGYQGPENRLYRVEIHQRGKDEKGNDIWKFKWSRDNGSIVASVTEIPSSNQLKVEHLGRDRKSKFQVGDWVEVLDDAIEFDFEFDGVSGAVANVGVMAKVTEISEADQILTLGRQLPSNKFPINPISKRHTRVRRWNQKQNVDGDGLLDVVLDQPIQLEDGIQVTFHLPEGNFKVGDYWVFATRTANQSVEELTQAPPRGILYHYARLALITQTDNPKAPTISDCRTLYPPADCCRITVRPGEDIQAAIDKVPEDGGCVCLAPGVHRITQPLLIDGRRNLTLRGAGNSSKVVFTGKKWADNLLIIQGSSSNIQIQDFLIHCGYDEHIFNKSRIHDGVILIYEASKAISIDNMTLIGGGYSIYLGECNQVAVQNSTLVGSFIGLSDINLPNQFLIDLQFNDNRLFLQGSAGYGIYLLNYVLNGHIERNRFHYYVLASDLNLRDLLQLVQLLDKSEGTIGKLAEANFSTLLDENLANLTAIALSSSKDTENTNYLGGRGPEIKVFWSENIHIVGNYFLRQCTLHFTRFATISDNHILSKNIDIGIEVDYGFNIHIDRNVIQLLDLKPESSNQSENPSEDPLAKYLSERSECGLVGIAIGTAIGATICNNHIQAPSGIGTKGFNGLFINNSNPPSLLRLLRIERPWRVFVDLAWVIRAIAPNLFKSLSNQKTDFEQELFKGFIYVLENFLPSIVSKVEVSNNQLQVGRFGICFNQIFTIGGLRILGNRISGFTQTGILVHPWFSVGFVKQYAQWLYWLLEYVNFFLGMLRDKLNELLGNPSQSQPTTKPPQFNLWGIDVVGITTSVVSQLVSFCSRYCTGTKPTEPSESNPAQELQTDLDDLLNHWDWSSVDDLLNQSYVINGNTLRGSGDGIWVGIDGAHITHNHVTIEPSSPVPIEVLRLCAMLYAKYEENLGSLIPSDTLRLGLDLDRDTILLAAFTLNNELDEIVKKQKDSNSNNFNDFINLLQRSTEWISNNSLITESSFPSFASLYIWLTTLDKDPINQGNMIDKIGQVKALCLNFLVDILRGLRGYGIALMGADMVCSQNQVLGSHSLHVYPSQIKSQVFEVSFEFQERVTEFREGVPEAQEKWPSYPPAIGGIWQFSNLISLSADLYLALQQFIENKQNVLPGIEAVIALIVLMTAPDRSLTIASNTAETALTHGIRTLSVLGLSNVEILDNSVKDAVRYGIYHQSLQFLSKKKISNEILRFLYGSRELDRSINLTYHVKVHRNTIVRTQDVYFQNYFLGGKDLNNYSWFDLASIDNPQQYAVEAHIIFFYALVWIDNPYGTILMSENHGNSRKLPRYYTDTDIFIGLYINGFRFGIIGNSILCNDEFCVAFLLTNKSDYFLGLFTNNLTDRLNLSTVSPTLLPHLIATQNLNTGN